MALLCKDKKDIVNQGIRNEVKLKFLQGLTLLLRDKSLTSCGSNLWSKMSKNRFKI